MIQIIRREAKNFHCLPCGVLFRLDEEPKVKHHCEKDHGVEYVPDEIGDVYDTGETLTPGALRTVGAL